MHFNTKVGGGLHKKALKGKKESRNVMVAKKKR